MARAKELVKSFFVGFYKFIRDIVRGFAHERKLYHEEQEIKKAGRPIYKSNQTTVIVVQTPPKHSPKEPDFNNIITPPKFNKDIFTEDLYPKKHKRRRRF